MSTASVKRCCAADALDERPLKRLRLVVKLDNRVDLTDEPDVCTEVALARQALVLASRVSDEKKRALDANMEKMQRRNGDFANAIAALRAKYDADAELDNEVDRKHGEALLAADESRMRAAEALKAAEKRQASVDRFWAVVGRFLHDGEVHVVCEKHGKTSLGGTVRSQFLCFQHDLEAACDWNCDRKPLECPGLIFFAY